LTEELQEASHLGRLDGSDVVYLAKRESSHPLRMFSAVGRRLPAHATAMGKAMLSLLPWNEVSGLLPPKLEKLTERTIVSRPALQKELELTRTRGYAIDDEESAELMRAVAVALPAQGSSNAISVSAPSARLPMDNVPQVAELLRSKMAQFPLR
jgi:DNA-binding IclR family transcriptional regulator